MSLTFKNISHSYDGVSALSGIDLAAQSGEILSLLGPSGCGKSTLLNLTAGVLPVQAGEILLGGVPLASKHLNPPPEKRPVGLVFQEGALFPHLTVKENIAFGVADKSTHTVLVGELLEQIGLEGFEARYPHTLSGGQQQRVALARALAPQPDVLLMDEPFANIDIILRRRLREQTRRILRDRNCTTILVTHDPEEAMEVSDNIAVMESGKIAAHGTAEALYRNPPSRNVAMLTGGGAMIKASCKSGVFQTAFGQFSSESVACLDTSSKGLVKGWSGTLLARPQTITLKLDPKGCEVMDVRHAGQNQLVTLDALGGETNDTRITLEVGTENQYTVGQRVTVSAKVGALIALEP